MATKYWYGASGDWYTGRWTGTNGATTTVPTTGDVAMLGTHAIAISASDVSTYGPLAGVTITFAGATSLDLTGETIGSATTIDTYYTNAPGTVVFRGASTDAGLLWAQAGAAAPLTVDLEAASGVNRLTVTSTGTLRAGNSGLLTVTGAAGAVLANAGTVLAGLATVSNGVTSYDAGTLSAAVAIDNTGTMSTTLFSTMTLTGIVTNEAAGTIVDSGGTLALTGGLVNNGTVLDSSGTLTISGGVSGSGTISVADGLTAEIAGAVSASQTIAFATGNGVLKLDTPTGFAGTFSGMTGHDLIDLVGLANATASVAHGQVTVTSGGTVALTFAVAGLTGTLNGVSDGTTGTILTLEQPGAKAAVVNTMVNGATGTTARNWGTHPTVTYAFDPASNWTTTEQAAFIRGMSLWSAMANITFVQAAAGTTGQVMFVRGNNGTAGTSYRSTGTVETAATVTIDTSVSGWQDLGDFGTNDTTGSGGYGWLTVLHELGHVLGLNHPGNYNETADISTQQTYYDDTRQYAVMSYFDAINTGANWSIGVTNTYNAETPMLFDIAAAQQIYGANTTTLSGNDVFGFNASSQITGNAALNAVYNFSSNPLPIVTLWSGGSNNTLDLSGYNTASTVDLKTATFSNIDGLTDNLAIAYNTTIDTAIGGGGNDIFTVNADNDRIDGGGGANTVIFANPRASYTIAFNGGTVTVAPVAGITAGTDTLTNIQTLKFSDQSVAACFLRGTRIRVARGEVPVEDLRPGADWAITAAGRAARIVWVGWRHAVLRDHPRPWDVMPVRVRRDAFAPGQPARDLILSPDHALLVMGKLIPVRHLINGATVVQESADEATWFHVELARHDAILAEGLPTESYLDTGNRDAFANGGAVTRLDADFSARGAAARRIWAERGMAPLAEPGDESGAVVTAARTALIARAAASDFRFTTDPAASLRVDGRALRPIWAADTATFSLPASARRLILWSRSACPADTDAASEDRRRLGVAVIAARIDGVEVPVDDVVGDRGWHEAEAGWRWTDGAADLRCPGARAVSLRIGAMGLRYWTEAPDRAPKGSREIRRWA